MASRFPPRDRSPHRYGDRRPLPSYIPSGPRGGDDANSVPLGREPPRGPKALIDSSRGGHFAPAGPRGRVISGRGEYRDRDPRDLRDGPPFRRDSDRDWPRRDRGFDPRDGRPPFGRGRSRSPPPLRDFRDSGTRDLDLPRLRRGSRDGPVGPMLDLSPIRSGSLRGRGRGDRERDRGRGRGFADDRDLFQRRSLSRDAWRDRDARSERERDRERERERERDRDNERRDRFERREDDRRSERDERDRIPDRPDIWKKDRAPSRSEMKSSSSTVTRSPSTVSPPSSALQHAGPKDDIPECGQKAAVAHATIVREQHKFPDKPEAPVDRPVPQFSPPPAVPEVPAFGSLAASPRQTTATASSQPLTSATSPSRVPSTSTPATSGKAHSDVSASRSVRPPTGPRADRVDSQHGPDSRSRPLSISDIRSKNEVPIRASRPPPILPSVPLVSSSDRRAVTPSAPDKGSQTSLQPEEKSPALSRQNSGPMSPPTGPSAVSSHGPCRSSLDINSPPVAHRRPSTTQTSPCIPFSNIPTGPRALQRPIAPRNGPKGSNQWVRPGYVNRGPSIINSSSPTKRESFTDEKDMIPSVSDGQRNEDKQHDEKPDSELTSAIPDKEHDAQVNEVINEATATNDLSKAMSPQRQEVGESPQLKNESILPMWLAESGGEGSDEEDDLDEEDFNQSEQRFEREMQALAAEMPPPPLQDPEIVGLLLKIQMLGMIAEGTGPASLDEPNAAIEIERVEELHVATPLPTKDVNELELPDALPVAAPVDEAPALGERLVETLPFANTGPPTPFSDMDSYQENLKTHDIIKDTLREEIMKQRKEIAKQHAELKEQYRAYYRPWRLAVDAMDRKRAAEEKKTATSVPLTPPAASTSATINPILEGRRGYRMNSELDFQNALKASTITAEEENARRKDKEATARPDLSREVLIPDMLDPIQKNASEFQDTNQMVDPTKAFEVFAFHLPPDNFTAEEHKIFTDTFMAHPKKWGKIAQALPGRTFQQCINHYYLTKDEMKYKAKLNKKWARRGRGRKIVARPPRSNALMADLGVVRPVYDGDDPGETTPAVTDTGRPRRAAAPTFGEFTADTETSTPTPSSGKRNSGKEGTDQPSEKPARRGGRGGSRGGRRARAQASANNTPIAAAPPKQENEPSTDNVTENTTAKSKNETEKAMLESAVPRAKSSRVRAKELKDVLSTIESTEGDPTPKQTEGGYGSQQPTSYWSVPEQRDFPDLVAHFGKDFEGISQFMKTKTPTMVRNYFQRTVDSGKPELEQLALKAEAKKQKGEPTGPLPVPSLPAKRRYDATPSSVGPRPLAPNTDTTELVDRQLATKTKPPVAPLAAAPPAIQPRQSVEKGPLQQAFYPSVQNRGPQMAPLSAANEDSQQRAARSQVTQAQRMQHGPRMGYFSENRTDARPAPPQGNNTGGLLPEMDLKRQQSHPQPITTLPTQAPMGGLRVQNMSRPNVPSQNSDVQEPPRYQALPQSSPFLQPSYLQPRPNLQATTTPQSHSRRPSRSASSTATSPVQVAHKMELNLGAIASADMLNQPKPVFRQPSQILEANRSTPVILSQKELGRPNSRPNSTPAQVNTEPPRQVPAKRSNIMSILNDEPEDPQPRKRFAGVDYTAPNLNPRPTSPSRPVYTGSHATSSHSSRSDDQSIAASQQYQRPQYVSVASHQSQSSHPLQHQQSHSQMSSAQPYSDFSGSYRSSPPGSSVNQDWMARFDPRGQQQSQPVNSADQHLSRLTRQPSTSHTYSSNALPHSVPVSSLQSISQQPQPSPQHQNQRQSFTHQALQPTQLMSQMQGQQNSSARGSPMPQHLQPFSQPSSPPIQRHSISFSAKSSHPRPTSPLRPSSGLNQAPHQSSSRFPSYSQNSSGHQIQSALENQHQSTPSYRPQGVQDGSAQPYTPSIRRVPSLSPRHQPSNLPQHQLAQHELQSQRQHRASLNLGPQNDSPLNRNPPPSSQIQRLSRGTGIPLERSYTPPSALSQHGPASGSGGGHMYSASAGGLLNPQGPLPPQQAQQQRSLQPSTHQLHHMSRHSGGGPGSGMDHLYDRR
ncbi:hypothetical protein PRK78_001705 [Emydomyces testavorans]|uniref:Myb-like domain-containing protein n=1 Tax=Emydomyces testavorans TaxID=2070801 RepID=A0AAF0IGY3_9EURO|nr:hypothetical protein PRK78_001705 [Emydomyces testavorans]